MRGKFPKKYYLDPIDKLKLNLKKYNNDIKNKMPEGKIIDYYQDFLTAREESKSLSLKLQFAE